MNSRCEKPKHGKMAEKQSKTPINMRSESPNPAARDQYALRFFPRKTSVRTVLDCSDAFRIAKPCATINMPSLIHS
jgi:hypothetical protein